ncbi:MAG: hypothetical protein WBD47_16135 [Phormidesmis sp.]
MLKRYQAVSILSTLSVLCLSSTALADQSIHQSVSGSTRASGENAAAMSHTEQSAYQSGSFYGSDQDIWQGASANVLAIGQDATAVTQIIQSAGQGTVEIWPDAYSQQDWGTAVGDDTF